MGLRALSLERISDARKTEDQEDRNKSTDREDWLEDTNPTDETSGKGDTTESRKLRENVVELKKLEEVEPEVPRKIAEEISRREEEAGRHEEDMTTYVGDIAVGSVALEQRTEHLDKLCEVVRQTEIETNLKDDTKQLCVLHKQLPSCPNSWQSMKEKWKKERKKMHTDKLPNC